MFEKLGKTYKVLIPHAILETVSSKDEKEQKVINYLKRSYPERYLVEINGKYAICRLK